MVFESVVAQLLNRFLGDYLENLDSSQLNVGIWGGNVVLNNLDIRPTALDNLDLPLKLKSGFLAKLTLQIPWKNLYQEPTIATVEGLYIIATPNLGIKYDAVKESKQEQDNKQRALQRIEEQRQEKRKKKTEKDEQKQDTFVEKLAAQVIKNLQVTVTDIHIRYEDQYTNKARPFSMGVTLHKLVFQTTDEHWNPRIIKETVTNIFKLVNLEDCAVYWNSGTELISDIDDREKSRSLMKEMIAKEGRSPQNFNYMLSPISIAAQLRLNLKPETDGTNYTVPKIDLNVDVKELGFHIGKYQYQDILEFLEAQERLTLNAKYRKYRPNLREYKSHFKEWWHFAQNSILEEQIRRRHRNWSWKHMKEHRDTSKRYRDCWVIKLTNKAPSSDTLRFIEVAERTLDVFNINVARQQAELQIDKRGLTRVEDQPKGWLNSISSWWSGGKSNDKEEQNIAKQFENAMTDDERSKLYEALDYNENQLPTMYPKSFVENKVTFSLKNLNLVVQDDLSDKKKLDVMTLCWQSVSAQFEQRPSANAIKFAAQMQTFKVDGLRSEGGGQPASVVSKLVQSKQESNAPQLSFLFETNPLDGSFDQLVKLRAQPLSVVYHAESINKLAEVFRPPESVRLKALAAAAFAKYEDIRVRSAAGLQYALENRSRLKLDIEVLPTIVQVPERGVMAQNHSVLILDLGQLKLTTKDISDITYDKDFYDKSEKERYKILRENAYDKFEIKLTSLQMLFARQNEDWRTARAQEKHTKLHILRPTGYDILLEKAAVDDLLLPKIVVTANFPDLTLSVSDERLLDILKLLLSIPLPPSPPEAPPVEEEVEGAEPTTRDRAKMKAIMDNYGEIKEEDEEAEETQETDDDKPKEPAKKVEKKEVNEQQVQVEISIIFNKISVDVTRSVAGEEKPYLNVLLSSMGTEFKMRPLDQWAIVYIGGLEVRHMFFQAPNAKDPLYLLENPSKRVDSKTHLLSLEYIQADKKHPYFATQFRNIEMLVVVKGQPLNVALHQEAFVDIQNFLQSLQKELEAVKKANAPPAPPSEGEPKRTRKSSTSSSASGKSTKSTKSATKLKVGKKIRPGTVTDDRVINMKFESVFSGLAVSIMTSQRVITDIHIKGLSADVAMRPRTMEASVVLQSIGITDPNPLSTYGKILSVAGDEVFRLNFIQYNRDEKERAKMALDDVDMKITMNMAEMRFVFLNLWLSHLLAWLTPFQEAAAAAAAQAGEAAMEGAINAAAAIQELRQTTKMSISVNLHAPVIIVPQNSRSDEALLANFGELMVGNKFTSQSLQNKNAAVFDNMTVGLKDMKLSRVLLAQNRWDVVAECQILEPVTFQLKVTRNLSFTYYKERPELYIQGVLPLLKVSASREDYGMVMKTLSGNLSEGAQTAPPPTPSKPAPPKKEAADADADETKNEIVAIVEGHQPADKAEPNVTKIEFAFQIDAIEASLYTGSSNLLQGIAKRDKTKNLASVRIETISASGKIMNDGRIDTRVFLFSLIMDDARPGRVGITRLMDKTETEQSKTMNMIDIVYEKHATGYQVVDLTMLPFFLCVSAEFLGTLGQFFIVTKTEEELEQERTMAQENLDMTANADEVKKPTQQQQPPQTQAPDPGMKIQIKVQKPEIILVEDATKPESSHAVILQLDAFLSLQSGGGEMKIDGHIKTLEVTSGYYDKKRRNSNLLNVLGSCEIILKSETLKDCGQKIEIESTPLTLRITPSVIRLLSAVSANLAAPPEQSAKDKQKKMIARQHVWDQKNVGEGNFWFMRDALVAQEALDHFDTPIEELVFDDSKEEKLVVSMNKIELLLEADSGAGTVPMIHLTSSFKADIREWTRQLRVEACFTTELWYYNERFNVWEPLIEPVLEEGEHRGWQLEVYVMQQSEFANEDPDVVLPPPKTLVTVVSTDPMELTVTKTLLEVLTELGDAFNRATKNIEPKHSAALQLDDPYSIVNNTGDAIEIMESDAFLPLDDYRGKQMPPFSIIPLKCKLERRSAVSTEANIRALLRLRFTNRDVIREVDVSRSETRIFELPHSTQNDQTDERMFFIVETTSHFGNKLINIRSPITIVNHLPKDIEVYFKSGSNLELAHEVASDGKNLSLPFHAVYSQSRELFFKPKDEQNLRFDVGQDTVNRSFFDGKKEWNTLITCPSVDGNHSNVFHMQANIEAADTYYENTNRLSESIFSYTIHLRAPVSLCNALPYTVTISATNIEPFTLDSGQSTALYSVGVGQYIRLSVVSGTEWTCQLKIEDERDELTAHTFESVVPGSSSKVHMDLGLRTAQQHGTREMTLYCPFWMINKTGLQLCYQPARGSCCPGVKKLFRRLKRRRRSRSPVENDQSESAISIFQHPPSMVTPLLFTFSGDSFFGKKKASLKVEDSDWSDKFPVDVVGNSGRIVAKIKGGKEYEVSVNIQLSNSGLTKICTFTPFYLIDNRCNADIEVRQTAVNGEAQWVRAASKQTIGFWPQIHTKRMQMCCRYADMEDLTKADSLPFPFTESFESLITMPNEFVGVYVSTHVSENSVVISFEDYHDGMAPALIVNDTENLHVYFRQKDVDRVHGLAPHTCALTSWDSILIKRILLWSCGDEKNVENELLEDKMGEFDAQKDVRVYWVSFLSGRQRVLLFTQDLAIATTASRPYELERIEQQYTISIQSITVSLINNLIGMEIATVAITSSGIIWEYKKRRWRPFKIRMNKHLEEAYVKYNEDKMAGKKVKSRHTIDKMEVDFEDMMQYKPKNTEIRRSFQSGFWMQYMQSPHEQQLHMKINHFQIDNQLPVSVFQTVLAPVIPPKSVAAESIPKPFTEVSFIMRKAEHSNIPQIKYFMVLVQEMAVQADQGFINAIIAMFTNEATTLYTPELYSKDVEITKQTLMELAETASSTEQKAFYEQFHLSPLKIHLSFSQGGLAVGKGKEKDKDKGDEKGMATPIHSEFLNLLLKSVGVTLTEIQDVVFKLDFFERKAVFMNRQQVQSEVISHYTKQAMKQFYVLVLGLDIIGNPFGLIRDLSTGVETFFYEPIQGAIQGPEEFAEGLALGVRSLFSSAVGGAAGAVSRITGTLGKGIAALTLDDEYQRKRTQMMARKPANVQEGLARGGKGLVMGFVDGITGVVTKPIEGAKREGAAGFAKGVGKGLVGVVTRPVSGVVDFASSSFQAVKRATDVSEEVKKLRPARFIDPDKIIRPFSLSKAEGNQLLQDAAKGKYALSDVFVAYGPVTADKDFHIVITDKRIMMVSKTLGSLEVDWEYDWGELAEAPALTDKGLAVRLKEPKKKVLGLFGKGAVGKLVKFADAAVGQVIERKAREAYQRDQ